MANDTGHRHRALTPWWAEVEIKIVIFHERVATDAVLYKCRLPARAYCVRCAYCIELPSTQMLGN